jgi:hypothetical protein
VTSGDSLSVFALEYFELFCTPDIVEVIAREADRYAQTFLENMSDLKLKSRTHRWKETNTVEIMKLLAFFLKPDYRSYFCRRKILETPIFLELFSEGRFQLLLKFLHFVDSESYIEVTRGSKRLYKLRPLAVSSKCQI